MRLSASLSSLERVERQAPPPHPSPLKGEGVGGGVGLAATDARREAAEWVRANLPVCSGVAEAFRQEFGQGVRMGFASEAGYTIGKPSPEGLPLSQISLTTPEKPQGQKGSR